MRRWIWILLIVLTVGLVSCAGLVGGGIWYASTQFSMKEVPQKDVDAEFARQRARFKDPRPILDTRHGITVASDRLEARAQAYSGPPPKNLCLLVWTQEQPKAVQFCLPFWLLKMKTGRGPEIRRAERGIAPPRAVGQGPGTGRSGPAARRAQRRSPPAGVDGVEAGRVLARRTPPAAACNSGSDWRESNPDPRGTPLDSSTACAGGR